MILCCILAAGCARAQSAVVQMQGKQGPYRIPDGQQLIIYTSHKPEVYLPVIREFEERTGIYTEIHAGGTQEMLDKVRENADYAEVDIMFGGGIESLEAYKDCFVPCTTPNDSALDPRFVSATHEWTPFTVLPIVFIYNNKLVPSGQEPRSWEEFLTDRWKGQIAFADPARSGTSYTILSTMLQLTGQEPEKLFRSFLSALDGRLQAGSGDVISDVASGGALVGITLEEAARKEIARGVDISMVYPEEGTSAVPDGCAVVKNAPHPENAELFIDFILSPEVQQFAVERLYRRSVRTDIPPLEAPGDLRIAPFDTERSGREQESLLALFDRILRGEEAG